ncbi:hypothetical protein DYBT9275_05709 [Dyadobacter sp. CECT 9275]|uniref:Acyl-CoA thioester hydrolase n=1 Tax=Dyadobacter helix TaxID=2822344 RepID=A0A916JHL3_9BACT|nr:thioesterase family protein [Dyadobacter sp. CECT 9275]CAG5017137.1 hypothetical protein DYBT9275_05709 [Dyadobacter sp. CECT 9275]
MLNIDEEKDKFVFNMKLDIRWSDMNHMHHVNNAVYLTFFEQGRIYYLLKAFRWNWKEKGIILSSAHIEYLRPILFPDPARIFVRTSKISSNTFTIDYMITSIVQDKEEINTTGCTTMALFDYKTSSTMPISEEFLEQIKTYERGSSQVLI